jgi:hypothetical protein
LNGNNNNNALNAMLLSQFQNVTNLGLLQSFSIMKSLLSIFQGSIISGGLEHPLEVQHSG